MITGRQIAAARVLLGISQTELASAAKLSVPTVRRMEGSRTTQDPGQFHASFGTPLRLLGLAGILYVAARAIGRVFDGFASTSRAEASE